MEDWSLQAVVGGCNNANYFTDNSSMDNINLMDDYVVDDTTLLLSTYPFIFESANELEQLYKPFYPLFPNQTLSPSLPIIDSKESVEKVHLQKLLSSSAANLIVTTDPPSTSTAAHASKYKRRKNQQKRVVIQVTAEALSSDVWAWRKYGQKPIKGSPYPRSYYRCSSSKGCLARKQVEQSCSDPGMFIITYTAEHSHTKPTRRNSLAGTNRNKPKSPLSAEPDPPKPKDSTSSPMSTALLSPITPSIEEEEEEEIIQQQIIKQEIKDEGGDIDNEFTVADMIFGDDFFAGLEDLGALGLDSGFYSCSAQQFPATFCS